MKQGVNGFCNLQLQRYSLQRLCASLHNLLSGCSRSSKGDLLYIRMVGEHWSKLVIAANHLHHPGRKNLLCKLDCFEAAVGGKGPESS